MKRRSGTLYGALPLTQISLLVERRADNQRFSLFGEFRQEPVEDALVHEEATRAQANLALISEARSVEGHCKSVFVRSSLYLTMTGMALSMSASSKTIHAFFPPISNDNFFVIGAVRA